MNSHFRFAGIFCWKFVLVCCHLAWVLSHPPPHKQILNMFLSEYRKTLLVTAVTTEKVLPLSFFYYFIQLYKVTFHNTGHHLCFSCGGRGHHPGR